MFRYTLFESGFVTSPKSCLKQVFRVKAYIGSYIDPNCVKLVGMVRSQIEDSLVSISEPEIKTVTRGNAYKFALLNSPKSCLKQVFQVKSVYLKLYKSTLSETSWVG